MADIKALKVIVGFENGEMGHCGAIEHEGAVWLVPTWLPFLTKDTPSQRE